MIAKWGLVMTADGGNQLISVHPEELKFICTYIFSSDLIVHTCSHNYQYKDGCMHLHMCFCTRVKLMIDGYVEVCSMENEADLNETAVARFE